jgi:hypothetical protein
MPKNRIKGKENNNTKPNVTKVDAVQGNIPLLTVQLLNQINSTLISILAYMKHRDLEAKK